MQLSFAYLLAAGLISVLLLLARRNRRQGWRRQRSFWLQVPTEAALRTVDAGAPAQRSPDFGHLGDLGRLRESLVAHGTPVTPSPAEKPLKPNVLA